MAAAGKVARRVELAQGDVTAIEIIEDGDHVRLAIFDEETALPLIAAQLNPDERQKLIAALAAVDTTTPARS